MREYIKKIVLAVRFIEKIVSKNDSAFGFVLNEMSLELFRLSENLNLLEIRSKIQYIIELIDLANMEGLITNMNASIFINSCTTFLKHLDIEIKEEESKKENENSTLKNLEMYSEIFDRKKAKEEVQNKFLETGLTLSPSPKEREVVQRVQENIDTNEGEKDSDKKNINRVGAMNFRHKRILEILSIGGLGLKELLEAMPDANLKTIQRDLLLLIRGRKLIMIGKKRWSKYYLK